MHGVDVQDGEYVRSQRTRAWPAVVSDADLEVAVVAESVFTPVRDVPILNL